MTEMKDTIAGAPTSASAASSALASGPNPTKLRRDAKGTNLAHRIIAGRKKNTKAEFKRLKTILPSIRFVSGSKKSLLGFKSHSVRTILNSSRRKKHVSKLDIILEAIKYIDDLQDQLIDQLSGGTRMDR